MSKTVSKDVREYWKKKFDIKFQERKKSLETSHHFQIKANADKEYPRFRKFLKLDKMFSTLAVKQKAYQEFIREKTNREHNLKTDLETLVNSLSDELCKWDKLRDWDVHVPHHFDNEDLKEMNFVEKFTSTIKDACYNEAKKAYYKSKAGQDIKKLDDDRERAMDILHSDMISEDWLKAISSICDSAGIACSIPQSDIKKLNA